MERVYHRTLHTMFLCYNGYRVVEWNGFTSSCMRGGDAMRVYEALMLMIAFGTLIAIILKG